MAHRSMLTSAAGPRVSHGGCLPPGPSELYAVPAIHVAFVGRVVLRTVATSATLSSLTRPSLASDT